MIVQAIGPKNAKVAFIGEAPGSREWLEGQPFVGPSGNLLMALLKKIGLSRDEVYLSNVIKDSQITSPLEALSEQQIMDYITIFTQEILQTSCNLYVPLGNTSLLAMTGQRGITNWRGSILVGPFGKKTIPTYHPAALLRDTSLYDNVILDFQRIKEEMDSPNINLPTPDIITYPPASLAIEFLNRIKQEGKPFAFDVETPDGLVACLSFANSPKEGISIDLFSHHYNREDFVAVYSAVKALLEDSTITKIGHNVAYDILALRNHGINVSPPYVDSMHKHHALDPLAPHGLAYLCSIFTRQPFYKQWDRVDELTGRRGNAEIENLRTYNAIDSIRTVESNGELDHHLGNRKQFYTSHYQNLLPHLLEMYESGLCINHRTRLGLALELRSSVHEREKSIAMKLGLPSFNANSSKLVQQVVYGILKCKPRFATRNRKRVLTADEETLLILYQDNQNDILVDIRDCKEEKKLLSFLDPSTKGAQKKRRGDIIRTEYKLMTKTGRLSSSASTATREGLNLQNQPKSIRNMFVPREGFIFLARDLPQAEAQVTAADANNIDLLHFFELSKSERGKPRAEKHYDIHRRNASISLSKDESLITYDEREACKRVVHGTNYGMGSKKQQLVLLKELRDENNKPFFIPLKEVERRRNNYLISDPSILSRQASIREELWRSRRLTNPFGRTILFHEIINDPDVLYFFGRRDYSELWQSAYAWFPQSTIADQINSSIPPLNEALKSEGLGRVCAQIHDELLMEIHDNLDSIMKAINISGQIMSKPITIQGYDLQIFPDIKLGYSWGEMVVCELDSQVEELYKQSTDEE